MNVQSIIIGIAALDRVREVSIALVAMGLGAIFIFGVGLADAQTLHAAAHDMRHGFAFPCH